MSEFFTKSLPALAPYTPGEQPQDQKYIKLNTNESPYAPSPWVIEALNGAQLNRLRLYSDPECKDLVSAIGTRFGLKPAQVMVGNGSDEVLAFAVRAFCDENTPLAFPDITYGCYKVWCGLMNVPPKIVPLKQDFSVDVPALCGVGATVMLANPNAPTGIALPLSEIEKILQANPDNVVIVDEAYVDFGAKSSVSLIEKYKNLLVVQTCSKSRNLAGARLGFAMGSPELIADLNRLKFSFNPYNVNRLTLLAGAAAMRDVEYFAKCTAAIVRTRAFTIEQLTRLGFTVLPSSANFVFARTPAMNGGDLYRMLKQNGILVRHFQQPRIEDWCRITIGDEAEMKALVQTLEKLLPKPAAEEVDE